ncbi:DUF2946 family protein [Bosea sp. TND4EK4]|uniref:DUF2946 family protein n=1 Tax=Bosea sp. TND4EK4 TaxID=1907408 RepID=UPI000953FE50|nr:DUF2946 family protein [Bosea sp. TND4EK4]SIR54848.1 hypothetical protein SAMN05880592_12929 [Bosea sp. TND4EK4]
MIARASMLESLRRSVLGAWLAAAYALTVLAVALAPVPAGQAIGAELGAVLCSGAALPGGGEQDGPAAPLGEFAHCKGCAHNPVFAVPPAAAAVVIVRMAGVVAPEAVFRESLPQGVVRGLPPSRAPPAA